MSDTASKGVTMEDASELFALTLENLPEDFIPMFMNSIKDLDEHIKTCPICLAKLAVKGMMS